MQYVIISTLYKHTLIYIVHKYIVYTFVFIEYVKDVS